MLSASLEHIGHHGSSTWKYLSIHSYPISPRFSRVYGLCWDQGQSRAREEEE